MWYISVRSGLNEDVAESVFATSIVPHTYSVESVKSSRTGIKMCLCMCFSAEQVWLGCFVLSQELHDHLDRQWSKGKPVTFDTVAVHDAAALLKLLLRELPQPLLTAERVNAFIQIDSQCSASPFVYTVHTHFTCPGFQLKICLFCFSALQSTLPSFCN